MPDVETTFRDHHSALYRYLVHFTGEPELAADAAQDAFAKLVAERPPPAQPKAWIFRVGTNLVHEEGRRRMRRTRLVSGAPPHATVGDPPRPPDRQLEMHEAMARIRPALTTLSERDRTVLLMRHEGFRHREIAEAIGTTTGSVGTMIARALDKLTTALERDEES